MASSESNYIDEFFRVSCTRYRETHQKTAAKRDQAQVTDHYLAVFAATARIRGRDKNLRSTTIRNGDGKDPENVDKPSIGH